MQYWMIYFSGTCPAGWNTVTQGSQTDCWRNSSQSVPVPSQPITNLANIAVTGVAGSSDMVTVSVGDTVYMLSQPSVLALSGRWIAAEFNVLGSGGGNQAVFAGSSATITVQTLTDSPSTSSAPKCLNTSFTRETNNLALVSGSCCAMGGPAVPGIQFTESNAPNPQAPSCPLLPEKPGWSIVAHPFDEIVTGSDLGGAPLMSCLGLYNNSEQVGKTRAEWDYCDIGYSGTEVAIAPYQTLVGDWADEVNGSVPSNALAFGNDGSGGPTLYSCRTFGNGNGYQLGKVRPGLGGCVFPYNGSEVSATEYQVLTSALPLVTQVVRSAPPPAGALIGGYDSNNAPLYVCQALLVGGVVPGKTRADWTSCDVSWQGQEQFVSTYNVLIPEFKTSGTVFQAGTDTNGSPLGICQVSYQGSEQVGKYRTVGACNFGFDGAEVSVGPGSFNVLAF